MPQIKGQEIGSSYSQGGLTQNNLTKLYNSKLHNEYSITGNPNILNKPTPSTQDRNAQTGPRYLDNPPT